MKKARILFAAALFFSVCFCPGILGAESRPSLEEPKGTDPSAIEGTSGEHDPWKFSLMLYWWLAGPTGEITKGDDTTTINATAFDIFNLSDNAGALFFYADAMRDRFGLYVDLAYQTLGVGLDPQQTKIGPLSISLNDPRFDTENITVEFALLYRFARWFQCKQQDRYRRDKPSLALDALVGFRYAHSDISLRGSIDTSISIGGTEIWTNTRPLSVRDVSDIVDPILGFRMIALPVEPVFVFLQGDIGGFGAGTDFAWHTIASLAYLFRLKDDWFMGIHIGYRALGTRDEEGSGPDRSKIDLTLHGPWFGFGFHY